MSRLLPWIVVVGLLAGGAWWARQRAAGTRGPGDLPNPRPPRKPGAVPTVEVATRDIHFAVTAAGDIGPPDAVSVRPEIGGQISKLTLDIGDKVKKGDVLFELHDSSHRRRMLGSSSVSISVRR